MRKMGFEDVENPAVMLIYNQHLEHVRLQAPQDDLSFERLVTWINIKYVQSSMKFTRRTAAVQNMMGVNAFVYLIAREHDEPDFMSKVIGMT